MKIAAILGILLLAIAPAGLARAESAPSFRIEFNDGKFDPKRIEVPANKRFELELVNKGQSAVEFESKQLRKEKVVAPGATATMVIRSLDPGEYDFFDDFHPAAPPAVLVAK
jgi:uncharacterized cupredoxin-like copper-binding protein